MQHVQATKQIKHLDALWLLNENRLADSWETVGGGVGSATPEVQAAAAKKYNPPGDVDSAACLCAKLYEKNV